MLSLIMLFIAPVLQIILSMLRINGRISTPIGAIVVWTFIAGIILTVISVLIVSHNIPHNPHSIRCGTIDAAFLFCGLFITIVSIPIIGLICGAAYSFNKNKSRL